MKKDSPGLKISKIGISNFLSFDNQSPVELGSLNIFVGKNSSGKSTILHALALLSETMYDPSEQTGMLLSGNGINLGPFENVVHKNDVSNPIKFDFSFSSSSNQAFDRLTLNLKGEANALRLGISTMTGYLSQKRRFVIQGKSGGAASFIKNKSSISKPSWVTCKFDHFLPNLNIDLRNFGKISTKSDRDKFLISMREFENFGRTSNEIANYFRNVTYIGPSRAQLSSVYLMEGRYPDRIDSEASNLVAFLLRHTRTQSEAQRLNRLITKWLGDRLELIDNTKIEKMKGLSAHILKGTDPTLKTRVALANTGYGVSQVLPIIAAKAFANKGAILIEQPELHLHPKAQAEIAELLLDMAKEGHQLFIETHSEHLILRLRSLVAQKKSPIPAQEIKLFHVNKKKNGSTLEEVSITSTGDLQGWPEGFFSVSSEDISAILRAKMSAMT